MKIITTASIIAVILLVTACGNSERADIAELVEASCKAQNGDMTSFAVMAAIGEKYKGDVEFVKKAMEAQKKPCK